MNHSLDASISQTESAVQLPGRAQLKSMQGLRNDSTFNCVGYSP